MKTNYVLIDYENVQPELLSVLDVEHFKVMVFVGANQKKLSFDTVSALQRMGNKAEYIKISGNGPDALDFHIAFYIGEISNHQPGTCFHVISKDTGFDPLIEHLKNRKISLSRWRNASDIPVTKAAVKKSPADKLTAIVKKLRGASKPRTLKTLRSTVNALFQKQLSEEELDALLKQLETKGYVTVDGTKVSYDLPASDT